ncbi:hypothetical protein RBSH_05070 [Rhodopirellula baltica SH28]|uniref:Uncharacterized protein n=1 Tax=Rhodopirellula baltica SH28 TaxID=993517 RepID=K5DA17_RHOBT|nr:hypothetical protein RBSH_05070 [Rhodopirellula baltica SH28]
MEVSSGMQSGAARVFRHLNRFGKRCCSRVQLLKLRFCILFCWPKAFIILAWGIAPGIENDGK